MATALNDKVKVFDDYLISKAQVCFRTFVTQMMPNYEVELPHEIMIDEIQDWLFTEEYDNLIIQAPPRIGKSQLSSRFVPAFVQGMFNHHLRESFGVEAYVPMLLGSYSPELATSFANDMRNYMCSPTYNQIFPRIQVCNSAKYGMQYNWGSRFFDILSDSTPDDLCKSHYFRKEVDMIKHIHRAGSIRSVSLGSAVTGFGSVITILDDMVKNLSDVDRPLLRKKTDDWYKSVISTRSEAIKIKRFNFIYRPKKLLLMTRWHEDDLIGRIIEREPGNWKVVSLPAEAYGKDDELRHPRDLREKGVILSDRIYAPERKKVLSKREYSALYQQKPAAEGGNIITVDKIRYYKGKPRFKPDFIIGSADLSFDAVDEEFSVKGSSFCVFQKWGLKLEPCEIYLMDQVRARMDYYEQKQALKNFIHNQPEGSRFTEFWIEKAANASAVFAELGPSVRRRKSKEAYAQLEQEIPFLQLHPVSDSKTIRLTQVLYMFQNGLVYLPEDKEWVRDYVDELTKFDAGKYDDQVDATSLALRKCDEKIKLLQSVGNLANVDNSAKGGFFDSKGL